MGRGLNRGASGAEKWRVSLWVSGWSVHTGMEAPTLTFCVLCLVLRTAFLRFISMMAKVSAFIYAGQGKRLCVVLAVLG